MFASNLLSEGHGPCMLTCKRGGGGRRDRRGRKGGRGGVRRGKGVTHGINTSELKPADDTREAIAG